MAEKNRYDIFLGEITSLEKQIYRLVQKFEDVSEKKETLEKQNKNLKNENEVLKLRLEEVESGLERSASNTKKRTSEELISGDKKQLKKRIDELIENIDYHLGS